MCWLSRVSIVAAFISVLVGSDATTVAAPLDLSRVAADSKWMMHLDMDAARDSTIVQRAYERATKMHPHAENMISIFSGMTGMDPRKDLHDVTVYGFDTDKRNAVMIVCADAKREFLNKMVEKAANHKKTEYRSYTLHSWTQKGWPRGWSGSVVGAFFKDSIMVFARTEAGVQAALDLLDGSSTKSVRATGSMLAGRTRPGSIMIARSVEVDPDTRCPVLKQGSAFRVALGESSGSFFYRAQLDMKNAAAAGQVEDVVKGFIALAALKYGSDENATKLLADLGVETDGNACKISWNAPADGVWKWMDKAAATWEEKRRQWSGKGRMQNGCPDCEKDGCRGCQSAGRCPLEGGQAGAHDAEKPLAEDEF